MNRTNIKGSITVEAIVMLGLIATLTPILYKHVAERRQDIENINEANTLLLLKNATAEYIKANKDMLTTGTVVLTPADIGVNISGYRIGIRKDSEGNIDAMIASAAGGNDLKAGKIASLLGVSAGIYSAQNTAKAWGINGVWAEDISNYGFTSLPTGIPVITTAYDKEENADVSEALNIDEIIAGLEGKTIKPGEICLKDASYPDGEYCVKKWEDIAELDKFKDAMKEGESCQNHSDCGNSGNLLCLKPSGQTTGSCNNPIEVVNGCTGGNNLLCANGYDATLNRNCDQIRKAYTTVSQDPPLDQPVTHRISTSSSGGYSTVTCWFPSGEYANNAKMGYTGTKGTTAGNVGLLDGCNGGDTFACRAALRNNFDIYWCVGWKTYGYGNGSYKLFHTQPWTNTTNSFCDMDKSPAWSSLFASTQDGYTYTLAYRGQYALVSKGDGVSFASNYSCLGGRVVATQTFNAGTNLIVGVAKGGQGSGCYWGCAGGLNGYGIYIGTRTVQNLAIAAGGAGLPGYTNWDSSVPCLSGGWLTGGAVGSSGCGTSVVAAESFGNVGTAPVLGAQTAGSGNAGVPSTNWQVGTTGGAGGCPSIYSPYSSLVATCNYSPTWNDLPWGSKINNAAAIGYDYRNPGSYLYAIGVPSGFIRPVTP